jgi:uncharacterized protein YbjT (DUF2867 family)
MTLNVLVTGARGKTGREVVNQLRGFPDLVVRAGSSQPAREPAAAVRPVRFDWNDQATWHGAVEGADAIYLMRPDLPDAPELVAGLVDLNPDAHVVLLSEQGAELLPSNHWVRRVEEAVMRRTASWTLLRPSWFQQVLTDPRFYRAAIRTDRVLSLPSGGADIAWVDARDIAEIAVAALVSSVDHRGRSYTITGPEAVGVAAVAAELSARLGYPVRAADPPVTEALQGLDPWTTDILDDIYRRVRQGDFARLSTAVEAVTGHKPRSVRQFIDGHVDAWSPIRRTGEGR